MSQGQLASTPVPAELTKHCAKCKADVRARVVAKENQNKGRWYYCCNSCQQFFCWGDYRPGISEFHHTDATEIFNSQQERFRTLPYTMSFDQVLSGELYTPDDGKMPISLQLVDADTFGLRTLRYDSDFVTHIKLLHWTLRRWDEDEYLWLCPTEWYTEIVGHTMAAGFPVVELERQQLEARIGIRGAARAPATPVAPSRRDQQLARRLFGDEEEGAAAAAAAAETQRLRARALQALQASSRSRSRPKSQDAAGASSHKRSKRSHKQEEEEEEASLCVVCLRDERQYVLVPCGHFLYCRSCAREVAGQGTCALCRQLVERCMKVYS